MKCIIYKLLAIGLICFVDLATQRPFESQNGGAAMTKEQVLERWGEALGGRQNLQSVTAVHIRGTIETGGMKGTYERWTTSRGGLRTSVDLAGAYRKVNVFDGQNAWTLDNSGAVHEIAGDTLKTLVSIAFEASNSFLFAGRIPGSVELVTENSDPETYVVRVEPQDGLPLTVYLDATTFLPRREETSGPMGKRIVTLSDWRTFGSMKFPATVRQSNGDPKFDAVITSEQVEINPALAADLFEKPGDAAAAVQFSPGLHEVTFPVQAYGDHVFLPVNVNGREPAWFFFDTAADMSFVSSAWAQKAGLTLEGTVAGKGSGAGTASMALAKGVVLEVPGARVPPATVAVRDLSGIPPLMGHRWDGAVGYDVISKLVVRVDYERERITLYDPATFVPDANATGLPLSFGSDLGNMPVVHAKIVLPGRAPIEAQCAVDSGADGFHLTTPFAAENHVPDAIKKKLAVGVLGTGGETEEFAGRIAGLQLGPYLLREPIVTFSSDSNAGLLSSHDIGALIGGAILKRFTVTFDFPHRRMFLEPNRHFAEPFRENESGLWLLAKGADFRRFEVAGVELGSPAEAAGVHTGDVLLSVLNQPAKELDLKKIDEILEQSGRAVPLTIQRKDRTLRVVLKLSERL